MTLTYLKFLIFFVYFFWTNIVQSLTTIPKGNFETTIEYETENPVQNAINTLKNTNIRFSFFSFQHNEILKQITYLDTKKKIQQNYIPPKLIKQNSSFFLNFFHQNLDKCIKNSKFPFDLNLADVTLCYKKK